MGLSEVVEGDVGGCAEFADVEGDETGMMCKVIEHLLSAWYEENLDICLGLLSILTCSCTRRRTSDVAFAEWGCKPDHGAEELRHASTRLEAC